MNCGKILAKELKLDDWDHYTGHTFRRTGASLLAESNVSTSLLKKAGRFIFFLIFY